MITIFTNWIIRYTFYIIIIIIIILLLRIKSKISVETIIHPTYSNLPSKLIKIKNKIINYQEEITFIITNKNSTYNLIIIKLLNNIQLWFNNIVQIYLVKIILILFTFIYILLLIYYINYWYKYYTNLSLEMETQLIFDTKQSLITLINNSNSAHEISMISRFDSFITNNNLSQQILKFGLFENNQVHLSGINKIKRILYLLGVENYQDYLFYKDVNYWNNISLIDPINWTRRYNNIKELNEIFIYNSELELKIRSLILHNILEVYKEGLHELIEFRHDIIYRTSILSLSVIISIFGIILLNSTILIN